MDALPVLIFFAVVISSVVLIVQVRSVRRGSGGSVHDLSEVAFLNGGPARVVDTALAAMQADGRIAVGGPGILTVVRPTAYHPVERAVLQEHATAPNGALHTLRLAVMRHPAVQEIGDGLAARGLLVPPDARRRGVRWAAWQGFGCLGLLLVSFVATLTGAKAGGVPFVVMVLPSLLPGGVIALICAGYASGRITAAGRRAALQYYRDNVYLADAGHLVALRGLRALPDPVMREQLTAAARHYAPASGGGSSSSDAAFPVVVWCAASSGGSSCGAYGGGGGGGGSSCGVGSGGGGGSSCSGAGSSCSSSSGGSSCSSSSGGSSCSSSSS
ncbi:TIGR04222 domain-containing membrane protein [Streptomyces purpureus]|uniref:TIGR04222 domain-containing membrane protein n=1 Tax=Streptomyces purpureus TaxID=1951 RepID=A0A918LMA7_9ACTN|nr:TIGR04222 domain-containing membrane protein [Streptomyces purpureus]GGT18632.1 hypothetical protein GCM10014713_09390 [Streptomyces purpureus]